MDGGEGSMDWEAREKWGKLYRIWTWRGTSRPVVINSNISNAVSIRHMNIHSVDLNL
jgi:hypothetical protein